MISKSTFGFDEREIADNRGMDGGRGSERGRPNAFYVLANTDVVKNDDEGQFTLKV